MKKLLIWSRVSYYNHCPCRFCYHRTKKYHPKRFPLPKLYLRQNLICPPASRIYLKELLNYLQTVSSCSRYTTFFHFGSRFHRQNLSIPKRSPLRFVLMRTSRKTHFRLWANLQITLMTMTYHKAMTGNAPFVPSCSLDFMDCLLSNAWHIYLLCLLVVILFMKDFWEDGRRGIINKLLFCTNTLWYW